MRRLYFPLLLTILLAGFLIGGFNERRSRTEISASLLPDLEGVTLREQANRERTFQKRAMRRVLTLNSETGAPVYGPLRVQEIAGEEILLLDSGDLSIKRFSPEGKLLARYGAGKGQGPGEFTALTDFAADGQGRVWAADSNNGRLTVFAPDGGVDQTVRLEQIPYRLSLTGDGGYFVTFMLTRDRIFGRFAPPQRLAREFGTFLADQGYNAMLLDGWMAPDGRGGFAYVSFYAGLLAAFDAEGRPRFYTELLDRPELPKVLKDSEGRRWVDQEAMVAATGLSVSPAGIHVVGVWREGMKVRGALDTYDLEDGSYRESLKLPETCESAVMTARHLYTISESSVSKWRLDA